MTIALSFWRLELLFKYNHYSIRILPHYFYFFPKVQVRYVGKKNREYYGDEIMEVAKIAVHWTGNQITCNHSKGWTTWIRSNCLKKVEQVKDQGEKSQD